MSLKTTLLALAGATALCPVAATAASYPAVGSPANTAVVRIVSFGQLAHTQAFHASAGVSRATIMPGRRLPDGSFTTTLRAQPALARLPTTAGVAAAPFAIGGTGIYEGSQAKANAGGELEPPDQGLAVANNVAGEVVNDAIQFFSAKTGKSLTAAVASSTFFGLDPTVYTLITDPRIVYDASTSRWFVEQEASNASTGLNYFAVAVSQTSDPLGSYYVYQVNAFDSGIKGCSKTSVCFPDYPQVGFDANGFFITTDLFGPFNFVDAAIYVLPKALLESGASFQYVRFTLPDFVVQPSVPAAGEPFVTSDNGTEYLMSARNILYGTQNIDVINVSNTGAIATAPTTLTASSLTLATEAYTSTVPQTQPNVIGPYGKSVGATSAPQLDGGYNAFGSTLKLAGGKVYGALTTGSADANGLARDDIAYFVVSPSVSAAGKLTASLASQGYVVPGTGYSVSYPSFALSKAGSGVIGFSITNPDKTVPGGYPSAAFISYGSTGPTGSIKVVGQGATSDDGFSGYNGAGPAGVGRWGDYSAGTVDPTTGYFYLGNEYIPNPVKFPRGHYANWGTFISQVR